MFNKILAPFDGSKLSECTLNQLKDVASGCQVSEVVLLTVIDRLPDFTGTPEEFVRKSQELRFEAARSYLDRIANNLKKEGINTNIYVVEGQAADEILDYVKENKIDLVVMSTHGRSGIARWTIGSVADKVVRHSPVPVLTVAPAGCRA